MQVIKFLGDILEMVESLGPFPNPAITDRVKDWMNFKRAVVLDPNDSYSWNQLGVLSSFKNPEKAIEYYKKGVGANPKDKNIWKNMGISYHKLEKYKKEIECLKKIAEIDPLDKVNWFKLGDRYNSLEEYREAIKYFKKALEIKPNDIHALEGIEKAYDGLEETYYEIGVPSKFSQYRLERQKIRGQLNEINKREFEIRRQKYEKEKRLKFLKDFLNILLKPRLTINLRA